MTILAKSTQWAIFFFIAFANAATVRAAEPVTLVQGYDAAPGLRGLVLISNQEEMQQAWRELARNRSPLPELPEVDFKSSMVLAFVDKVQFSGGYSVDVTDVTETDTGVSVVVKLTSPDRKCIVSQSLTRPYHWVKVPVLNSRALNVSFKHEVLYCDR